MRGTRGVFELVFKREEKSSAESFSKRRFKEGSLGVEYLKVLVRYFRKDFALSKKSIS